MSDHPQAPPPGADEGAPSRSAATRADLRQPAESEQQDVACPACGSLMRLWANYHRCRNCGYKESCCF